MADMTRDDRNEAAETLKEARDQIAEALECARGALRALGLPEGMMDRCRRGWMASIEMALDDEHQWLGRDTHTLADTIADLLAPECPECGGDMEREHPEEAPWEWTCWNHDEPAVVEVAV